jgi:hypothetical protein
MKLKTYIQILIKLLSKLMFSSTYCSFSEYVKNENASIKDMIYWKYTTYTAWLSYKTASI